MNTLYTFMGSAIERHKKNIGKHIGGKIYVHKRYMSQVIPVDLMVWILRYVPHGTKYNTVMWDTRKDTIRFDEALNFNTAREPWAGDFITINVSGKVEEGHTEAIWHHKWMWVQDNYKGFDVKESYEWSELWLSRLKKPASGSLKVWQEQLKEVGL